MKFAEMSFKKKLTLSLILSVLLISLFLSFYLLDNIKDIDKMKKELQAQTEEIDRLNRIAEKYEELKKLNIELKSKLEALTKLLPKEAEVSGVLRRISEIGLEKGLTIYLWKPQSKSLHPSKEVYEIPVEISMKGKYHTFGSFFSKITYMERILNFKKIELKIGSDKDPTIIVSSMTAVTYSIVPEEEKQKDAKK